MGKNILIFSDGTGNIGGILFDEDRSNIYKLYRATRVSPDSNINPQEQVAYYDAGLGSKSASGGTLRTAARKIYNLASQATGLGITKNMIDCYEAIIRHWEPDDRIFLFGFSRGAYTVRCLAGVLAQCGIPTRLEGRGAMKFDRATVRRVATIGVKKVYQHTTSWERDENATKRQRALLDQRDQLAAHFRETFGSNYADGMSNAIPHFIGVFDTVASLANWISIVGFAAAAFIANYFVAWIAQTAFAWLGFSQSFWWWYITLALALGTLAWLAFSQSHLKFAFTHFSGRWWRPKYHNILSLFSVAEPAMRFYDQDLNVRVGFARHAISIDERRSAFNRLKWGNLTDWRVVESGAPTWLRQFWFAGNHSDIGGSYPENESRLSDIALKWMIEEAEHPAIGLKVDHRVLALWASPGGMQHDETRRGLFQLSGKMDRDPVKNATVHESVVERFKLRSVLDFDSIRPYRPGCLAQHERVIHFYDADVLVDQFAEGALLEAMRRSREALAADNAVESEHWTTVAGEIQRRLSEFKN